MPDRRGPDAPPLHPACARSRFAPRACRAAGARPGVVVVLWLCPGEAGAHCAEPPSVKPAARPDPSGPSAHPSIGSDRHRGQWVTSGGAGRIGGKRLDPRALRLLGRLSPAGQGLPWVTRALPLPSFATAIQYEVVSPNSG
jgi:hypothetical protein